MKVTLHGITVKLMTIPKINYDSTLVQIQVESDNQCFSRISQVGSKPLVNVGRSSFEHVSFVRLAFKKEKTFRNFVFVYTPLSPIWHNGLESRVCSFPSSANRQMTDKGHSEHLNRNKENELKRPNSLIENR